MLKIIFMGTPDFAVPALKQIVAAGFEVVAVYTAPPKPAGRGKELRKSAVHLAAEELGINVLTPPSLKTEELLDCDIAVVAAYGLLLPKHILQKPKYGCLNIHPSLLPRWRGAAPLQRTVMAGDKETAVCIMQMDIGLDTGDVLLKEKFPLSDKITVGELHDKCSLIGAELTVKALQNIGNLKPERQSEEGVTYAKKITPEDEVINWNEPAQIIDQKIRGLNPFPAAYFMYNGEKFKVLGAEIIDAKGEAGVAVDDNMTIAVADKAVRITKIQRQGKKLMDAKEFLNGFKLPKGTKLN